MKFFIQNLERNMYLRKNIIKNQQSISLFSTECLLYLLDLHIKSPSINEKGKLIYKNEKLITPPNIHHWDELNIDTEMIDTLFVNSHGYGHKAQIVKRSGIPVSFGIILFYWNVAEGKEYYLIAQRRDTITYADFIRGKYKLEYLPRYFTLMTPLERKLIESCSFETIWDDMHIYSDEQKSFARAKRCWDDLCEKQLINFYLDKTQSLKSEPEWEFPKGRKMKEEDALTCALREFEEESCIPKHKILPLKRKQPFVITFYGSNDKVYQTVYFPAIIKSMVKPDEKRITSLIRQTFISQEVGQVKWVSFDELHNYIDENKYKLIRDEFHPWIMENIDRTDGYMHSGIRKMQTSRPSPSRSYYTDSSPFRTRSRSYR